ncbi:MAG: HAMP domain-containing sensor histidine kinase [Hyphomicrobiales bacterium]|nr:HAMP domain-containing sensor histidine kinase [Hyphomicrobiales bacterium]
MSATASPFPIVSPAPASAVAQIRLDREKVVSRSNAAPDLDYQLLSMFVKNELLACLAIPVLAVVVAFSLMSWAPGDELKLWLATVFVSKGIFLLICRRFMGVPRAEADVDLWRRHLVAAEFFHAMTWASIAFVDVGDDRAAFFFLFAMLMVVMAIRMIFALTVLPIIYAGTIPLAAAVVIRFLLTGEPFFFALAVVTVGIHICLIFLVKGLNFTVLAMLGYRAEKDALIAELEQAKAVSDEARRRAEEASAAKSTFLATMSHELRTPLNAILGFSEVMKGEMMGPMGNKTYKAYAGDIHESGQHLLKLINEILDISRIEAGRYELVEQPVLIKATLSDCCRLMRLRADGKGIKITEAHEKSMPRLWADERAVRQICLNLLSNAIKFTPAGGAVAIRSGTTAAGEQFISVRDDGPGIPAADMPVVMKSFGQGSVARTSGEGGAGLGLPIVKGLVEMHGGRFELNSDGRRGTEAIAIFPRVRVMQPQPHAARVSKPVRRASPQTRPQRTDAGSASAPVRSAAAG